jgi:hypothetical protein
MFISMAWSMPLYKLRFLSQDRVFFIKIQTVIPLAIHREKFTKKKKIQE